MSYFDGIKVGDKIWTIQDGEVEVREIEKGSALPIITTGLRYTMEGRFLVGDKHQSAFWSDPHIVAPPKPKRMVKKVIERWVAIGSLGQISLGWGGESEIRAYMPSAKHYVKLTGEYEEEE